MSERRRGIGSGSQWLEWLLLAGTGTQHRLLVLLAGNSGRERAIHMTFTPRRPSCVLSPRPARGDEGPDPSPSVARIALADPKRGRAGWYPVHDERPRHSRHAQANQPVFARPKREVGDPGRNRPRYREARVAMLFGVEKGGDWRGLERIGERERERELWQLGKGPRMPGAAGDALEKGSLIRMEKPLVG